MSVKLLEDAKLKSVTTATGVRTLDFYAASFSAMPDKQGDTIDKAAFNDWIGAFYAKGEPLPISFAHAAVRSDTDPSAIIGYAPADAEHVWVDDYGLRVKGTIYTDTDQGRHVARLIDDGVVRGASLAFVADEEDTRKDGSRVITKASVKEAGPCMYPANDSAVVLSLKDNTQTTTATLTGPTMTVEEFRELFLKHQAAPNHLQSAHDALVRAGAKCMAHEAEAKVEEEPAAVTEKTDAPLISEETAARLRRLRHMRTTLV